MSDETEPSPRGRRSAVAPAVGVGASTGPVELRRLAEEAAAAGGADPAESEAPDELRRTVHELRVHQIELEMQNEELRSTQAQLEAWQARYLDLYDQAPVGFLTFDEAGVVREANLTVVTLLGASRDAVIGAPLSRFLAREDQDAWHLHQRQLFAEGRAPEFELRLAIAANPVWVSVQSTMSFDAGGRPAGRAALVDRTRSHAAEEALERSEDKFRTFFEESVVGKSITQLTGELKVNRAFCEMLGYSAAELESATWQSITHPDDIELTERAMEPALAGRQDGARFTKRFLDKDGSPVWADIASVPRRDEAGRPLYWMTTAIDITAKKAAEERARAQAARLRIQADAARAFAAIGVDRPGVLDELVRRVGAVPADGSVIWMLSDDGQCLEPVAVHAADPGLAAALSEVGRLPTDSPSGRHLLARVIRSGESLFVPILTRERLLAAFPEVGSSYLEQFPVHSLVAVPLSILGANVGVVVLLRHQPGGGAFTEDDLGLVEDLVNRAGNALSKIRLRVQMQQELADRAVAEAALEA
ncbi:MAG TPA: PAS domain S-box protein, partial [Candidatus Limnocylindrales bacterium]